jgi:hypothetical protein
MADTLTYYVFNLNLIGNALQISRDECPQIHLSSMQCRVRGSYNFISDHAPILTVLNSSRRKTNKSFRFEN